MTRSTEYKVKWSNARKEGKFHGVRPDALLVPYNISPPEKTRSPRFAVGAKRKKTAKCMLYGYRLM